MANQPGPWGWPRVCPRDGDEFYRQDCLMKRCLDFDRCWPAEGTETGDEATAF